MTIDERNARAMRSAQARYDNMSDPRLEEDDDGQCFVARVDGKWMNCTDCGHDAILDKKTEYLSCYACGSEEVLDCSTQAERERWIIPE